MQQQQDTFMEQDTVSSSLPSQAACTSLLLLQAEEEAAGSTAAKALEQLQGSHSSIVGCLDAAAAQGRQGACSGISVCATCTFGSCSWVWAGMFACNPFTVLHPKPAPNVYNVGWGCEG